MNVEGETAKTRIAVAACENKVASESDQAVTGRAG
ncbi:hypothetical protein ABH898_004358 [Paenibacillus sp. RC82]